MIDRSVAGRQVENDSPEMPHLICEVMGHICEVMGQVLEDLDILHSALPSCREQPNTQCVPADESFESPQVGRVRLHLPLLPSFAVPALPEEKKSHRRLTLKYCQRLRLKLQCLTQLD